MRKGGRESNLGIYSCRRCMALPERRSECRADPQVFDEVVARGAIEPPTRGFSGATGLRCGQMKTVSYGACPSASVQFLCLSNPILLSDLAQF